MRSRFLAALLLCTFCGAASRRRNTSWRCPGYQYQFPRDHFNHPDYQTEWWYYTGNLHTADGHGSATS